MKLYDVKRSGGTLTISRSLFGRCVEAATRFALWAPLALAAEALFFLPDYLRRFRHGAPDERLVFWGSLVGLAALIAGLGAFVRFIRRDAWILDADRQKLVFQTRPFFGRTTETEVDLDRVVGLEVDDQPPPKHSSLAFRLRGYPDETLGRTRWGTDRLTPVVDAVRQFGDAHGLELAHASDP